MVKKVLVQFCGNMHPVIMFSCSAKLLEYFAPVSTKHGEDLRRKILALFWLLSFSLAACAAADTSETIAPSVDVAPPPVPTETEAPAETEEVVIVAQPVSAITPATTAAEAAVIREQDHVIGADEPAVAIIEYGDYQ